MIRSYQKRDFDDCDFLQRSFYKFPASQEELRGRLEGPSWVAVELYPDNLEQTVLGNIICTQADEPEIWSIVVAAAHRGQGVGSKLMSAAEDYFKGRNVHLYVEPNNPAKKFYEDRGYRAAQFIVDHYGEGYPAILMDKNV